MAAKMVENILNIIHNSAIYKNQFGSNLNSNCRMNCQKFKKIQIQNKDQNGGQYGGSKL